MLTAAVLYALFGLVPGRAQSSRADWLTDGGDPQRTGWQPVESRLTPATAKNLQLLWTIRLDNEPREMHALFPPLIAGNVSTASGLKEVAVVAGVSDNLFGIDVAAGTVLWRLHFDSTFQAPPGGRGRTSLCPGGQTATPLIAPTGTPGQFVAYAVSWDGRLRQVDVATGKELVQPTPFLPANGKPYALNLWRGVIYTTTSQRCGDNPNLAYALDLAARQVSSYSPAGGGMWGRRGPSIATDGTIFTGVKNENPDPAIPFYGQAILALTFNAATKALTMRDFFSPANFEWMIVKDLDMSATGPVFTHLGREFIVQSSKECRLWLLDSKAPGGADHHTPVAQTALMCNERADYESAGVWGALSTWVDAGTRWIVTPFWGPKHPQFRAPLEHGPVTHGAVAAFTLDATTTGLQLTPRWISGDMNRADPTVIAGGVVFGYGSGESTTQRWNDPRHPVGTEARIAESTHAVLYALDGKTGETLWSSGDTITSWNHYSGLSVANGRVYIGTYDGNLYCFGVR